MTAEEPRDLAGEARHGRDAGLPNDQAGPAVRFNPSFPPGSDIGPQDALAAIREAIPPLPPNVEQQGQVYPVVPPPAGDGRNTSEPAE